jgi:hypothetical protein
MSEPAQTIDPAALHEEGGLRYLSASEVPGESIVRVLSKSFSREPMARALGASARDLAPFVRRRARVHEQRSSVVAARR